jgi:hypothetical protein
MLCASLPGRFLFFFRLRRPLLPPSDSEKATADASKSSAPALSSSTVRWVAPASGDSWRWPSKSTSPLASLRWGGGVVRVGAKPKGKRRENEGTDITKHAM